MKSLKPSKSFHQVRPLSYISNRYTDKLFLNDVFFFEKSLTKYNFHVKSSRNPKEFVLKRE